MRTRLGNVQALRGLACLLVVTYHAAQYEQRFGLGFNPLRPVFRVGYGSIDIFFAISGFVMAYVHRDRLGRSGEGPRFLLRRFWRVYSTYWAVLLLAVGVRYWLQGLDPTEPRRWADLFAAVSLWKYPPLWMPQAWTLCHELAFYLVFALLFPLPRRWVTAVLVVWLAAVVGSGVWGWYGRAHLALLWLAPCVGEVLLGAILGLWFAGGGRARQLAAVAAAGVWLAAGYVIFFDPDSFRQESDLPTRVLTWGVPAVLLLYAAASVEIRQGWRAPRWLQTVGEASYSIYLVHLITQISVAALWNQFGAGAHRKFPHVLWALATIGTAIGFGWVVYRLAEKPLLEMGKSRRPKPTAVPAPSAEPTRRAA